MQSSEQVKASLKIPSVYFNVGCIMKQCCFLVRFGSFHVHVAAGDAIAAHMRLTGKKIKTHPAC